MNKTKPNKFTFKNEARSRGLASIGEGTPSVHIRYAGVDVGFIHFNDHWNSNRDLGIKIGLMVPRDITPDCSCKWKWITLKRKFTSGDEAKTFLNEKFAEICKILYIPKE
jgi:hypothetical protein